MTATEYMNAAIDHAQQRRADLEAKYGNPMPGCSGWVCTPKGDLKVNMVLAEGRSTRMAPVWRKTWTLGGKRIAAAKISEAIAA
jgi:hypothetical protein